MKLLVMIPAWNEAENIVRVVEELKRVVPHCDYVIINDGSTDETAEICRSHAYPMLDLPANLGLTGAFQTGMRYACEMGYDAAIQIDGDGQHDPAFIGKMMKAAEEKNADIVIGSRFVSGKKPRTLRMLGNTIIEIAIRLTTGKRITDPTSGMRLYGPRLLKKMAYDMSSRPEPDTVAYLIRAGAKVEEVQVNMRERTAGESYLNFGKSIKYMAQMCMNIFFVQWVRKRSDVL